MGSDTPTWGEESAGDRRIDRLWLGLRQVLARISPEGAERVSYEEDPDVMEGTGVPVPFLAETTFKNWGRTVANRPARTFFPRTIAGVQSIVRWAAAHDKRVRVAGYRHTWTDFFGEDNEVLISTLPLDAVTVLPAAEPTLDPNHELMGIEITEVFERDGQPKALCRIGAATTNEMFRRWCLDPDGGSLAWTVPLNVIMVEITYGGSNGPICHGAGLNNPTLSDLVRKVEFVNATGELQVVDDPEQLKAAAGCFGLLGPVIAITLELDAMRYARLRPTKQPVAIAVPPPDGFDVPEAYRMPLSPHDRAAAIADFERRAEFDYYAEWFWFPYQSQSWINSWNADGDAYEAKDYPSAGKVLIENFGSYLSQLMNHDVLFQLLPGRIQARYFGELAMLGMPTGTYTTALIDALHFQRGIQDMRVFDMEFQIPLPPRADDPSRPDFTVVREAWWRAIQITENRQDGPLRVALEMRIMSGSEVIMAPQRGNTLGTCAIEILTLPTTSKPTWVSYMQEVMEAWSTLTGPTGQPLSIRPHWAKQWQELTFDGKDAVDHYAEVYADAIGEFGAQLGAIAKDGGYTLDDLRTRFSNPVQRRLFGAMWGDDGA